MTLRRAEFSETYSAVIPYGFDLMDVINDIGTANLAMLSILGYVVNLVNVLPKCCHCCQYTGSAKKSELFC